MRVYVDGVGTQAFLARSGLDISYQRGRERTLAKRMSRLFRGYSLARIFDQTAVRIVRQTLSTSEAQVWDGAGVISRRMLEKMVLPDDATVLQTTRRREEIASAGRVEFTILTERGQEKGHAIVADQLTDAEGRPIDFLLPEDIKGEIRLVDGSTFVGLNVVHGRAQMRADLQSVINLHPFLQEEALTGWLEAETDQFMADVSAGRVPSMTARQLEQPVDIARSPLREFVLSGGDIRHFRGHIQSVIDQQQERLAYVADDHHPGRKLRLPLPGGRLYVMPDQVGQAAGRAISVPTGQIHLDLPTGTAWINANDWYRLPSSEQGIAGILGGADNDDALWIFPFTDRADGEQKVLAWRSPNEAGEYVVLKPTAGSDLFRPLSADGPDHLPLADSRQLPQRVDQANRTYLGLVQPRAASMLAETVTVYRTEEMDDVVAEAKAAAGALGVHINTTIVHKAVRGDLPVVLPDTTEAIIDATAKTGDDISGVRRWDYETAKELAQEEAIPSLLTNRLHFDPLLPRHERPVVNITADHYLDRLTAAVDHQMSRLEETAQALTEKTQAPNVLYDAVLAGDPEAYQLGAALNQRFAHTLADIRIEKEMALKEQKLAAAEREITASGLTDSSLTPTQQTTLALDDTDFDRAKWAVMAELSLFPREQWTAILRGALVSTLLHGTARSDTGLWKQALRDVEAGMTDHHLPYQVAEPLRHTSLGQLMNEALREIEVVGTPDAPRDLADKLPASYRPLRLQAVWYAETIQGSEIPSKRELRSVSPEERAAGKQALRTQSYAGTTLTLRRKGRHVAAFTSDGRFFGRLTGLAAASINDGERVQLRYGIADGGDLLAVVEPHEHPNEHPISTT